jgi:hypothetical protein
VYIGLTRLRSARTGRYVLPTGQVCKCSILELNGYGGEACKHECDDHDAKFSEIVLDAPKMITQRTRQPGNRTRLMRPGCRGCALTTPTAEPCFQDAVKNVSLKDCKLYPYTRLCEECWSASGTDDEFIPTSLSCGLTFTHGRCSILFR